MKILFLFLIIFSLLPNLKANREIYCARIIDETKIEIALIEDEIPMSCKELFEFDLSQILERYLNGKKLQLNKTAIEETEYGTKIHINYTIDAQEQNSYFLFTKKTQIFRYHDKYFILNKNLC